MPIYGKKTAIYRFLCVRWVLITINGVLRNRSIHYHQASPTATAAAAAAAVLFGFTRKFVNVRHYCYTAVVQTCTCSDMSPRPIILIAYVQD